MASGSESVIIKLAELKKDVIEILHFCEGGCLELNKFKKEYGKRYGRKFDTHYRELLVRKNFKMKRLMEDLDDIMHLDKEENIGWLMKLREPSSSPPVIYSDSPEEIWDESTESTHSQTSASSLPLPLPTLAFSGAGTCTCINSNVIHVELTN